MSKKTVTKLKPAEIAARAVDTYFEKWAKTRAASFESWYYSADEDEGEFFLTLLDDVFEAVAAERRARYANESAADLREYGYRDAAYLVGVQVGMRLHRMGEVR